MPNKTYDNFFLANEIEDQYNSHLDLVQFCTVDNSLTGTAGMDYKVHVYKATDGTEKLTKGEGNTKTIEADFTEKSYKILLAQNRFSYFDEDAMTDPMVVTTGTRHMVLSIRAAKLWLWTPPSKSPAQLPTPKPPATRWRVKLPPAIPTTTLVRPARAVWQTQPTN